MSIDSADAPPPPPPPPPPPDYSVADEPVIDEGPAPPDSTPSPGVDTATPAADTTGVNGSGTLDSADGLVGADAPVVDEGQAAPDLATGPDAGSGLTGDVPSDAGATTAGSADLPAGTAPDAPTSDQPLNRKAWEASGAEGDLPPAMREDLGQLGQDLRNDVDPDAWAKADRDDRAAMLAGANDRIRETYGLPPGNVSYADLAEEDLGEFDPNTGDITLDNSLLDNPSPDEAINTLSHENYHDYQQHAIDGKAIDPYAESRADAWRAAEADYSLDRVAYMENTLEVDAYAVERPIIDGYRRQ